MGGRLPIALNILTAFLEVPPPPECVFMVLDNILKVLMTFLFLVFLFDKNKKPLWACSYFCLSQKHALEGGQPFLESHWGWGGA